MDIDHPVIVDGEPIVVEQRQNPARYCSSDNKIAYDLPGCFHPNLTPFAHLDSFCMFSNYAMPPLDTFVCEFMAYFFWSVNEMVAQHLTEVYKLPGIPNYVMRHNANKSLSPLALELLQKNFETSMILLQEKNAKFHSVAAELADISDETAELAGENDSELARRLVEATSDLVISAFFTILARVYLGRRLVKPETLETYDMREDALVKMAAELLTCNNHTERRVVFDRYAEEQIASMLVKNVYDEGVQRFLESPEAFEKEDKDSISKMGPVYIVPTVRRFFEDLVVHTIYLIASPDYLLSMCTIQHLHAKKTSNTVVKQPTGAKRRLEEDEDVEDTKIEISAEKASAPETPLKWFMGVRAEQDEKAPSPPENNDLLLRRGVEFENFRRMIQDLLNKL